MKRTALVLVAMMSASGIDGAVQQPARDTTSTPTVGTASISGTVVNDEVHAQPVRRAIVTLTGTELKPSRGAITDDDGRFTISNLPAGRFTLTVTRAAFVTSVYGAKRPGRPGTPIVVSNGATITNLSVRIWRGAAVAGIIRDETGTPVPNLPVVATPARDIPPGGILTLSNNGTTTNDLGEYRIFGLGPGPYVVSVRPPATAGPTTALADVHVDAVLDALRRRAPGQVAASAAPVPQNTSRPFSYAPIYFPGTTTPDQATVVRLLAGEERLGLDISLQRVAAATVTGSVARPDGSPAAGARVQLSRIVHPGPFASVQPPRLDAIAGADGRFRISQVQPGEYRLIARVPSGGATLWAVTDVAAAGFDIEGVALTARPGLTISGRMVFSSSVTPPTPTPAPGAVRVTLVPPGLQRLKPNTSIDWIGFTPGVTVQSDGTFRLEGLLPDAYVLSIDSRTIGAPWAPRSAMIGERDLLDGPIDFAATAPVGALVITYSDRRSELSGTLQAASGAALSDVFVIAYSTDRRSWSQPSRRVQAIRPGVDGRFDFSDVPPGEYLLGAVTDLDQDEWLEPGFLDGLVATSVRVTILEGEKKVQDLKVGG